MSEGPVEQRYTVHFLKCTDCRLELSLADDLAAHDSRVMQQPLTMPNITGEGSTLVMAKSSPEMKDTVGGEHLTEQVCAPVFDQGALLTAAK